jgi:carboxyl-terminal processing protease
LVNGSSASASEVVAGTLQDYNRALILGSPTYGKATAQVVLPMDTTIDLDNYTGHAEAASYIKLTTSKLYRITGATAQMNGVQPHIVLPEPASALEQRESGEKFALPATPIEANKYYRPLPALPLVALAASAQKDMEADPFFREAIAHQEGASNKPANRLDLSLFMDDALQRASAQAAGSTTAGAGRAGTGAAGSGAGPGSGAATDTNTVFMVTNLAYEKQRLLADPALQAMNEERKKIVWADPYIKIAYQLASVMLK